MKHARRTSMQQHHARYDAERQTQENQPDEKENEYYRADYIQFIDRLMQRMEMDKLQQMLDRAMELTT